MRDFAAANPWLGEYALYRALKARFGQTAWFDWPDKDLLNHDPAALAAARQELADAEQELADAEQELADARPDPDAGWADYAPGHPADEDRPPESRAGEQAQPERPAE